MKVNGHLVRYVHNSSYTSVYADSLLYFTVPKLCFEDVQVV